MMDKTDGGTMEMPMGMAMSIAMNSDAMNAFCRLSDRERAEFINKAKIAGSREKMTEIVNELAKMK